MREALKLTLAALKQIDEAMPFPVAKLAIMEAEKALAQPDQLFEENERLHVENRRLIERIETIGVPVGVGGFVTTTTQPEQEPVATLWQHGETGRTRITMPDDITDCDARWFKAADLYTTPPQQELVCVCGAVWEGQELIYTRPQRKPLTDEEIKNLINEFFYLGMKSSFRHYANFARAIEAAIWEKLK